MQVFKAKRYEKSFSVPVAAPPEKIFPLLCPVREYEWIHGWDCLLVYSESGVMEEGCVFITDLPGEGKTVWVGSVHDPEAFRVEFIRFTPGIKVLKMELKLDGNNDGGSFLNIAYTQTSLSEEGNALIDKLKASDGAPWEARTRLVFGLLLNHFVKTGAMLKEPDRPA